ncbi:MAG: hypothetical protein GWN01_09465 [Nitrosopumilaceae archaeon]|nr:undecaprenyl diphosphate synthase family protein [Nitrosopumilaceae archaeon]NIU87837.1 hypothetical protein [Nitrosopumilaceae archaeon]NIV65219.1 hypothetical protein [Nitrosopumilaceae archaeon]NIX61735.1 hypothetical protein [Nitrosopumilaceae archaeon]
MLNSNSEKKTKQCVKYILKHAIIDIETIQADIIKQIKNAIIETLNNDTLQLMIEDAVKEAIKETIDETINEEINNEKETNQ